MVVILPNVSHYAANKLPGGSFLKLNDSVTAHTGIGGGCGAAAAAAGGGGGGGAVLR